MKHTFLFSLFLIAAVSCQSQTPVKQSATTDAPSSTIEVSYTDIDIKQAKRMVEQGKDIVILDVRTPEEVAAGKIANSINIDINATDFRTKLNALDRKKVYLVYCHAGGRSAKASNIMREMNFLQVFNMKDGFRDWNE